MRSNAFVKSALWQETRRKTRYSQVYFACFVLFCCCLVSILTGSDMADSSHTKVKKLHGRSLLSTNESTTELPTESEGQYPDDLFTLDERRNGAVILHIMGMCYMFLALAIACDEFFVPSLAIITEKLDISEDVAGATFMAAGGSAPELFTSFIGTFVDPLSNVGFGTIVGSAVFNVLFVIGMCAVFSRTVLKLTWWPLFRDCLFYSVALCLLIVFFRDEEIEWWESLILLLCYLIYVTFMKFNHQAERWVKRLLKSNQVRTMDRKDIEAANPEVSRGRDLYLEKAVAYLSAKKNKGMPCFRYGALQLVIQTIDPLGEASIASKATQLKCLSGIQVSVGVDKECDLKNQQPWYTKGIGEQYNSTVLPSNGVNSQKRNISNSTSNVSSLRGSQAAFNPLSDGEFEPSDTYQVQTFHSLIYQENNRYGDMSMDDATEEGKQRRSRLSQSLVIISGELPPVQLKPEVQDSVDSTMPGMYNEGRERRTSDASKTSRKTIIQDDPVLQNRKAEDATEATFSDDSDPIDLSWPDRWKDRIIYIIKAPLLFPMYYTALDCRRPEKRHLYPWTFLLSICWIGGFSYLMVWWAKEVGITFGINTEVMGLTFLAAGTSIPDLITSVLVARKGFGDMAVSSSIGSNMFDITVGLPVPWLVYSIVYSKSMGVSSDSLFCSVVLLFVMLLAIVVTIAVCKWRMSKLMGFSMFMLYVVFLVVSVLLQFKILTCPLDMKAHS